MRAISCLYPVQSVFLRLVAGGFRCKRCDGTIQESVLAEDLLLLFAFQSMFISIWVSCLEIAEFPDSVRRSDP